MGLRETLNEAAAELGFSAVGVTDAAPFSRDEAVIRQRVASGWFDGLPWFDAARTTVSCHPTAQLPGARSVISLAMAYGPPPPPPPVASQPLGRIAAYALGADYHRVVGSRLKRLKLLLMAEAGGDTKPCVDSSPMVDRAAAERSGVGFFGKHTTIINPHLGSYLVLGELVTTAELAPDSPSRRSCGSCTRCLPACPTGAIVAPWAVDNSRCISYLTIEHRGPIPLGLRAPMGDWIFGCDICQEVCPINQRVAGRRAPHPELAPRPDLAARLPLLPLLDLDDAAFRERFAGTAVLRARRGGLIRNACIALGNSGDQAAVAALGRRLGADPDPQVRGAAAWALGRLGGRRARQALERRAGSDSDAVVAGEISQALAG